jgi:hypothetical protein
LVEGLIVRNVLVGVAALLTLSSSAWADTGVANPFVQAYGADVVIAGIEVRYRDGVLPRHQDSAAANYAEHRLGDERRAAFEAMAQPRGLSRETSAERMAEYLTESDLRARADALQGTRRVNVAVTVVGGNAPSMLSVLVPGANVIPTLDYEMVVTDAETGAQLATAQVTDVYSIAANIEDARRRNDLEYNFSGTDQNFRTLAGQANALATSVVTLLRASILATGRTEIGTAFMPSGAAIPITTANARYVITITPPPAAPPPAAEAAAALTQ